MLLVCQCTSSTNKDILLKKKPGLSLMSVIRRRIWKKRSFTPENIQKIKNIYIFWGVIKSCTSFDYHTTTTDTEKPITFCPLTHISTVAIFCLILSKKGSVICLPPSDSRKISSGGFCLSRFPSRPKLSVALWR